MNRREFLAVIVTSFGVSGCLQGTEESSTPTRTETQTATATPTPEESGDWTESATPVDVETAVPDNPFGKLPIVVGLERRASGSPNANDRLQEAISYWEENADTYVEFEDVEFAYRPNSGSPDILVEIVDEIRTCGQSEHDGIISGCAPLLTEYNQVDRTARIKIIDELDGDRLTDVMKHEVGHTLGLDHSDEPAEIMSHDPELRIPDYEERKEILSLYANGVESYQNAIDDYDRASSYYASENFTRASRIFSSAAELARESRSDFGSAESIASEIDQKTVAEYCTESRNKASWATKSFQNIERAAENYAAGNNRRGDQYVEEHQSAHARIDKFLMRPGRDVAAELGFPTEE